MDSPVPDAVAVVAREVLKRPGVVGVFWGQRYRAGAWLDEECLSVHVRWKRPAAELPEAERLPSEIDGIPIDVIETGLPKVATLDMYDTARPSGSGAAGPSSITALARDDAGYLALLCGHGTLPQEGREIARVFEAGHGPASGVDLVDGNRAYRADLIKGHIGGNPSVDYAIARLPAMPRDTVQTFHASAGSYAPFWLRSGPLRHGELLSYISQRTKKPVHGRFRLRDAGHMILELPDETPAEYGGVFVVDSIDVPFIQGGDSGALVVDAGSVVDGSEKRPAVVGMVLGNSRGTLHLGYVLSARALSIHLGHLFSAFFKEQS